MLNFVRCIKYKRSWFWDIGKSNLWKTKSKVNLNNNSCLWKYYCTHSELSLPESKIKKYLKAVTDAYKSKYEIDEDLKLLVENYEIASLLKDRLDIEDDMKNLEELGQQDAEIKKSSQDELSMYLANLTKIDEDLMTLIMDKFGQDDCRDIIFEITAGVGGQEAMLFTSELLTMYNGYFEYLGFNCESIEVNAESGVGGIRHASILVSGVRAYELLRHEGGVHRVQRVPTTEKYGRMQTSTATVAVLPQPSDIEVNLLDKDLKIETKRSSGAGGQHVNTTDSAVRIIHLPTGIAVECQTERSQIKNKQIAMLKLRTKIYNKQLVEMKESTDSLRKKQRGMSQRNEKIRTYNYSQDRISDHRITNGTLHNLKGFMMGGESLKNLQERLQKQLQMKLLKETIEKYTK